MPIEWNALTLPMTLTLTDSDAFGVKTRELEVRRGPKLGLETVARATARPERKPDPVPGTEARGAQVRAATRHHDDAVLEGYLTGNTSVTSNADGEYVTRIDGRIWSMHVDYRDDECTSRYEWLTNVPRRIWSRVTERRSGGEASRQRDDEIITAPDRDDDAMSRDYTRCDLALPTLQLVRIGSVASELVTEGMPVVGPGFIQFVSGPDGMPDEQLRHSVRRAFEFLFGGGLGSLGACNVDRDGLVLRAELHTPYVPGPMGNDLPPALLDRRIVSAIDEKLVTNFVKAYVQNAAELDLDRVVWLFLHAQGAPLDMTAGYVGAAFEVLRRGFYARPANAERSRQVPRDMWRLAQAALSNAIDGLAGSAEGALHKAGLDEVKKRLGQLNDVSGTRLNRLFLGDLGLAHGPTEVDALQARNDAAHGNRLDSEDHWPTLQAYRALHTLVGRVMFAILGVEAHYIDYSALGHPARPIREAQGSRS